MINNKVASNNVGRALARQIGFVGRTLVRQKALVRQIDLVGCTLVRQKEAQAKGECL